MSKRNIKEMVKNKNVNFVFFKNDELWYTTEDGFLFPVPIFDTQGATFEAKDKAMLFMRYIRKEIQKQESEMLVIEKARAEHLTEQESLKV